MEALTESKVVKKVDVIVVGAGASGLSAALTASLQGASVLLLEKSNQAGGCANFAEGVFGVETRMQRERWMNVTRDQTFIDEMNDTRWEANVPLVRRFQNQSADTIEWLLGQGVEFEGPQRIEWTNQPTWHIIKGHGKALAKILLERLKEREGVTLMFQTPVKDLLVEEGRVVGVRAIGADGKEVVARSRGGVIISTGGFANNPEMLMKYANLDHPVQLADIGRTGDGINMARRAGAQCDMMSPVMLMPGLDVPHKVSYADLQIGVVGNEPRNVWVDKFGERFTSEAIAFDFIFAGNAMRRIGKAWAIFDEPLKHYYETNGTDTGLGVLIPPMHPIKDFQKIWDEAYGASNGAMAVASSVRQLADATGLPFEHLQETLTTYNRNARAHRDAEFAKDPRWLQPLDLEGPLYAVRLTYSILTTLGGIKVDKKLRALDSQDLPVPGLFITGNDAGGLVAGDTYTLTSAAGTSFGFAVGSGRMAALEMMSELNAFREDVLSA